MKNIFKIFCTLIITLFLISNVAAQNYVDALRLSTPGLGSNARALGMGNAYNSISDDFSATFFNPAGLGLINRMEFSGTLNSLSLDNSTTFFNNQTDYTNSTTDINQVWFLHLVITESKILTPQ